MNFANLEPLALDLELPWQNNPEQEQKFQRLLKRLLIGLAVFALVIPWLPVFEKEYEVPEREITKTRVLLEPVIVEPEPVAPPPVPKPKPKPVVQKPVPKPKVEPPQVVEVPAQPAPKIKDKASVMKEQGLSDLSSQLSSLRNSVNIKTLQRKNVTKSELGKMEHSTRDAFGEDIAAKRSQGIEVDDAMLKQEQVSLAAYSGVAVQASGFSDIPGGSQLSFLSEQAGRRDMENIRRTFESAKSSVYSVYLQSLHDHPELAGKFIFRLVIEPDGTISELQLVTSELGLQDLESVILNRIKSINFGPKEVSPTAVEYAFSFIPS